MKCMCEMEKDKETPACDAAAAYGIDVSQLEYNLSLTPSDRLRQHESALELVRVLREAGVQYYGCDPRSTETPE
jgi:hypothetical protein